MVVALLEVISVLAVLPFIQVMTGESSETGALGTISRLLGNPPRATLAIYLALVVVTGFVLKATATAIYRWWSLTFIAVQELDTSKRLLTHLLRGPYALHLRRTEGEMIRIVNDAVGQSYGAVNGVVGLLTEVVLLSLLLLGLLLVMPVPTLVAVAYFGVAAAVLLRFTQRRVARGSEQMLASSAVAYVMAHNALAGIKEIKIRDSSTHFVNEFGEARLVGIRGRRAMQFFSELPRLVLEVLFIVGVAATAWAVIATEGMGNGLAKLALFAAAGYRMLPSLSRLIQHLGTIKAGSKGLELILPELINAAATTERVASRGQSSPMPFVRSLELERVSFSYDSGPEVLHDVSLTIPTGTSLALVGPSGSGKSTLVDLVLGLLSPTSGRITADGTDIASAMPSWQDNLAIVPQEVVLFNGTLAANIAFDQRGDEIDEHLIEEIVDQAQLRDLLRQMPDGLATELNGSGVRLSGGQRQRVGIARALYRRPRLLILDEATSALDNATERRISDVIETLRGHTSIIIVAHRLSTVRECDSLAYLDRGRVAGLGTFDQVRAANEDFNYMVRLGSLDAPIERRRSP